MKTVSNDEGSTQYNVMQQCVRNLLVQNRTAKYLYSYRFLSPELYSPPPRNLLSQKSVYSSSVPISTTSTHSGQSSPLLSLSTFTMLLTGCSCVYNIIAAIAWCTYIAQLWHKLGCKVVKRLYRLVLKPSILVAFYSASVIANDLVSVKPSVLRHSLILRYISSMESLRRVLRSLNSPRVTPSAVPAAYSNVR